MLEQTFPVLNTTTNETVDVTYRICERCDIICETCSAAGNTACITCRPGFELYGNGSCLPVGLQIRQTSFSVIALILKGDQNAFLLTMMACLGLLFMLVLVFVALQLCDYTCSARSSNEKYKRSRLLFCVLCQKKSNDTVELVENGNKEVKRLLEHMNSDEEEQWYSKNVCVFTYFIYVLQ